MKVIVNGRFLLHRTTGVERYAREILLELDKLIKAGEIEMAIPPETKEIPAYKNIRVARIGKLGNRLWEHVSFPLYVMKNRAVSLNLCNVAPLLSPGVVCIHDMKIKAKPEYFSKKFRVWYELLFYNATKRAKKIITVSGFSKKEIIKYYGVKKDKIIVIPNAWQHYEQIGFDEECLKKYNLDKNKYYFAMSSLEPNKNFKWVAETASKDGENIYAIAGSINSDVFRNGLGFECPPNVKLLGFVSDQEAKTLMRDCKAFLFPSIYEGFGIPPLEAISSGCRSVYVSNIEVMHEIFKDCVGYIDLEKTVLEQESVPVNKDILNLYSWKHCAEKLYELIKSL